MTNAERQAKLRERRKDLHRLNLWVSPEAEMLKRFAGVTTWHKAQCRKTDPRQDSQGRRYFRALTIHAYPAPESPRTGQDRPQHPPAFSSRTDASASPSASGSACPPPPAPNGSAAWSAKASSWATTPGSTRNSSSGQPAGVRRDQPGLQVRRHLRGVPPRRTCCPMCWSATWYKKEKIYLC